MKKHYVDYLERYRNNSLSKDELVELFDWINSPEGEAEYDHYLLTQLDVMSNHKTKPIHIDPNLMLKKIKEKANIGKTYTFGVRDFMKYAAILVIALLSGSLVWMMTRNPAVDSGNVVFAVAKGNKGTFTLPDGSEVWLNAESKVAYTGSNQRKITLEGEAYLQIAKDKKREFVVSTPFADIIVYGTTFNVAAYPEDSTLNVSLLEGSVGIKIAEQDDITQVTPGQVANFNVRNGKMELYNKDLTDLALWRNDELVMVNISTNILCGKMEAWYGVSINLIDQPAKNHLYNMTIRHETIDEMLELINKVTPIVYHIQKKEVTIKYIK